MIDGNQVVEEDEKDDERKFREELLIAGMEEQLYGKQSQPSVTEVTAASVTNINDVTSASVDIKSPIATSEMSQKSNQVPPFIG